MYAILTEWPGSHVVLKNVQPKPGSSVTLVGSDAKLRWTFDAAQGTVISLPAKSATGNESALRLCVVL